METAEAIDPEHRYDSVEAVASAGTGVFETLKLISKLTLRTLRRNGVYFIAVPAAGQSEPNWASIRVVAPANGNLPQLEQSSLLGSKPVCFDYIVVAAERA